MSKYIEGEHVTLRAPELSDLNLLYNWENDTSLWYIGETITPFSKYVLSKYLETAHLDIFESRQLRLMIDLTREHNRTIGTIDLFDFDPFHNRAGIGILIADEKDRNKGFASDTLEALIAYCFEILGLNQLYCNIGANNKASLGLFQKHGFEIVGLKKQWHKQGTKFYDEYLLQLLNKHK